MEVFAVVFLNKANKINHFEIISKGGITGTVADPRVILKKALEADATSIVLCHNHPSGNLRPSKADEEITFKIREAAKTLKMSEICSAFSFPLYGELTRLGFMWFIVYHTQRHIHQLKNIAQKLIENKLSNYNYNNPVKD